MKRLHSEIESYFNENQKTWLITGVAGFIGSHLLETLLLNNQKVIGLDNFITGSQDNLDTVRSIVGSKYDLNFEFIQGDICDFTTCMDLCQKVDHIFHQAALGSVPRSLKNPVASNLNNVTGFLNMITAAKDASVESFTYASSSSVYGDHPDLPKQEEVIGSPISPYALTKRINEDYAQVFSKCYNFKTIGLRYFNVFGPRQNPNGPYAAVIPKWMSQIMSNEAVVINGDGKINRDFCYIDNAVQANILAAIAPDNAKNKLYNIAFGQQTSLDELFQLLKLNIASIQPSFKDITPIIGEDRPGDIKQSLADITNAKNYLGYTPLFDAKTGIKEYVKWFMDTQKELGCA